MKKSILLTTTILFAGLSYAQQIGNSDFEAWDNLGQNTEEPGNWSSFMTASGGMAWAAGQQIQRSTDIRPGSTGSYSSKIWSKSVLGIIANGNMTLGQVVMGSSTATDPSNYNISKTSDANFSEALTQKPDSLVFWVKFTAASGSSEARCSAVLHDTYDYKDGYNVDGPSAPHKVAEAQLNFTPTGWVRKSIPWNYTGPASANTFILVTFTTNKTPGSGAANDAVFVDDMQLIYNTPIVANDDNVGTYQDVAVDYNVLTNDTDAENNINVSSLAIVTPPSNGTTQIMGGGVIKYTPNAGYVGADSYTYSISDNGVVVTSDNAVVNVTVTDPNAANGPIVANDDSEITAVNQSVDIDVLTNDVDPEVQVDIASINVTVQPNNGIASANTTTGIITYTPDGGFVGTDNFTYEICDLGTPTQCDEAVVTIEVSNIGINEINILAASYKLNGNTLSFVYQKDMKANVVISDLSGKIIAKGLISDEFSLEKQQMYIVNIYNGKMTQTFKIVK